MTVSQMGGIVGLLSQFKSTAVIKTVAFSWSSLPHENNNEVSILWHLVITVVGWSIHSCGHSL